jgi:hypothetical protein
MQEQQRGPELWRQSARGSILALVVGAGCVLLGAWFELSDPRTGMPLLVILSGFGGMLLLGWALVSGKAIVAMYEKGLLVGWVGGPAQFVPWGEVAQVEDTRTRQGVNVYETASVHCRGAVYSVSTRFIGGKSFRVALGVLGERAPAASALQEGPRLGRPPGRPGLGAIVSGILLLVCLAIGNIVGRQTWTDWHGWNAWPRVTAVVIRNEVSSGKSTTYRPIFTYEFGGQRFSRESSASSGSPKYQVGASVEQAVDPAAPSNGVTLYELDDDYLGLACWILLAVGCGVALAVMIRRMKKQRA